MFAALEEPTSAIVGAICNAIAKIPSDCVNEVFERGIMLCGGGSLLDGLDKMIGGITEVRTTVLANPMDVVSAGLSKILSEMPEKMPKGATNVSREYLKNATMKGRV
jgi:rod shape-determining protein MreB